MAERRGAKEPATAARGGRERPIASALLVAYVALLVLGGWPAAARPTLFDRPHYWAQLVLWVAGIRPGIEVFSEPSASEYKFRAHCIHIEGRTSGTSPITLHPPGGRCHTDGFRARVPPMDVALYRVVRRSWELRRGALGVRDPATSDRDLERIGRAFCERPELVSEPDARVMLVWYAYVESYVTGAQLRGGFVYYGWSCAAGSVIAKHWRPDAEPLERFDEAIIRFWGSAPWA
jgi:hypothetical protein